MIVTYRNFATPKLQDCKLTASLQQWLLVPSWNIIFINQQMVAFNLNSKSDLIKSFLLKTLIQLKPKKSVFPSIKLFYKVQEDYMTIIMHLWQYLKHLTYSQATPYAGIWLEQLSDHISSTITIDWTFGWPKWMQIHLNLISILTFCIQILDQLILCPALLRPVVGTTRLWLMGCEAVLQHVWCWAAGEQRCSAGWKVSSCCYTSIS